MTTSTTKPAPALRYETILAALTVLTSAVALGGCAKTESAAPAPESRPASAATAPPPDPNTDGKLGVAPPSAAPLAQPGAPPPAPIATTEHDGGLPNAPRHKGPSASCGAGGCSPDMKKGGK